MASNLFVRYKDERDAGRECFKLHFDIASCLRYTRKKFVKTIACKRNTVDGKPKSPIENGAEIVTRNIYIDETTEIKNNAAKIA